MERLNLYLWVPKKQAYGDLAIAATSHAASVLKERTLMLEADPYHKKREFELPGTSRRDVKSIGGGLDWTAKRMRLGWSSEELACCSVQLSEEEALVDLTVCHENRNAWISVFEQLQNGHSDVCERVDIDAEAGWLALWACFGHLRRTQDPESMFPE